MLNRDFLPVYCRQLENRVRSGLDTDIPKPLLGLHVVVDAGNGAGGFYAKMLEDLGAWVEGSQFLEPDGHFPNHIPNPENEEAMRSISEAVVKVGAEVVKMGLRVPSVKVVLKTDNNRVMSLYFGTFNIPLQCTTTMVHRNTINSVTIKQLILRI